MEGIYAFDVRKVPTPTPENEQELSSSSFSPEVGI